MLVFLKTRNSECNITWIFIFRILLNIIFFFTSCLCYSLGWVKGLREWKQTTECLEQTLEKVLQSSTRSKNLKLDENRKSHNCAAGFYIHSDVIFTKTMWWVIRPECLHKSLSNLYVNKSQSKCRSRGLSLSILYDDEISPSTFRLFFKKEINYDFSFL